MPAGPVTCRHPLSAVVGADDAKRALECLLINPGLRTVLVCGGPGTAKSTLARAVAGITSKNLVECPPGITGEQLLGSIDMEEAVRSGRTVMEKGLLGRADGNILHIDGIDLMDGSVLTSVFDAVLTGRVRVERGPVSAEYGCDTVLIATMDPEGGGLSPHMMDRFSLCVSTGVRDRDGHVEVLRRDADRVRDPQGFLESYREEEESLKCRLDRAERILPAVTVSDGLVDIIAGLCAETGVPGSRGDLSVAGCARALAALDGRDEVLRADVEEAVLMCLPHRTGGPPPPLPEEAPPPEDGDAPQDDDGSDGESPGDGDASGQPDGPPREEDADIGETVFETGDPFRVIDYIGPAPRRRAAGRSRKGGRTAVESRDGTGRYVRYRVPAGRSRDIAFDATFLAAAPHQRTRRREGLSLVVEEQDIREKVRRRRNGCTLLFLVDASGSLGVKRRMTAVKGTVMSMLKDSYVKRDRIGLMAFRRDSAEMILPPTRSVEYGCRRLEDLPTGGRTPLGEALVQASSFMTSYSRCNRGERCFVVLVTDGRANVPLEAGRDANEEVRLLAGDMCIPGVEWIVVDAGARYPRFDDAEVLAANLGADYFRLDDMDADRFAAGIRAVIDE
jgi:magnesium chelatase subunit D